MAKRDNQSRLAVAGEGGWLTLKEAARLCNMTPAELRNQIERGKLRAHTVQQGGKVRFRLLRSSLVDAGLLGPQASSPEPDRGLAAADFLALIREQNQRISALEDQRALLAGQLGAALERLRSIDERLHDLESLPGAQALDPAGGGTERAEMDQSGIRHSLRRVIGVTPSAGRWKRGAT